MVRSATTSGILAVLIAPTSVRASPAVPAAVNVTSSDVLLPDPKISVLPARLAPIVIVLLPAVNVPLPITDVLNVVAPARARLITRNSANGLSVSLILY